MEFNYLKKLKAKLGIKRDTAGGDIVKGDKITHIVPPEEKVEDKEDKSWVIFTLTSDTSLTESKLILKHRAKKEFYDKIIAMNSSFQLDYKGIELHLEEVFVELAKKYLDTVTMTLTDENAAGVTSILSHTTGIDSYTVNKPTKKKK